MRRHLFYIVLSLLVGFVYPTFAQNQVSEDQIEASILYYICDFIEWPQENSTEVFSFGILGDKPHFFNELNLIAEREINLKGKPIEISRVSREDLPEDLQVLVVSEEYYDEIKEILAYCQSNSVLMITDELDEKLYTVINFYYNDEKEAINFEVNKQNLILSRFDYRDDILLYGGSLIDVKELYQSTQILLENESKKAKDLQKQIQRRDRELAEKNSEIQRLNHDINESKNILDKLSDSISSMSDIINEQAAEMESKLVDYSLLVKEYETLNKQRMRQEGIIQEQEERISDQLSLADQKQAKLDSLDRDITSKENTISEQSEILADQNLTIQRQNLTVVLLMILGGMAFIIGLLVYRAYRTKNRYNNLLESTNKELQSTNNELSEKNKIINEQNVELKKTLNNLKEAQMKLLQAEKMASLGVLTAGVAHEINNPLNYIMGSYVGLDRYFRKEGKRDDQTIDMLLKSLKTGVDKASGIVQGLNQFSRDNETFDEPCDIHLILDNCIEILKNQLKHRIEVEKSYQEGEAIISGNTGKLHQVFLNILNNASQAIEETGTIIIKTNTKENELVIEIIDDGVGIEKEHLSKITDPFFTTKDPGKGTGLGLSITYNILQEHQGDVSFDSEPGNGTKVRVILPLNNKND